jgi:putative membrane protein
MQTAAMVATLLVAVLHVGFMYMEMVLFSTPKGRRIFGTKEADAQVMKVLAANQGIYNGAVAAVLAWAQLTGHGDTVVAMLLFVIVVGIYGGVTVSGSIFGLQVVPAAVALGLAFAA